LSKQQLSGVAPDVPQNVLEYFKYRNVTPKILKWVNCTYEDDEGGAIFKKTTCAHPYPDIKIRWSRFPLVRDWLEECTSCTGPVLVMDVRDSFFQLDPFGPGSPVVNGLQVFQEHPSQRTLHWLTNIPFTGCKNKQMNETMLCSGTTVGTRPAVLKYLEVMYEEMKVWINDRKCRFNFNGDDQSMHNWLFYTGQLPFATSIYNRAGGIVNTVGVEGAILAKEHREFMMKRYNISHGDAMWKPFRGASGKRWIGEEFNMADDEGSFTEADGSKSRVIHQFDRFGRPYVDLWFRKQDLFKDPFPGEEAPLSEEKVPATGEMKTEKKKKGKKPKSSALESASAEGKRKTTDTGIDVSDPELYEEVDLNGDSSTATVMGMASGYGLSTYEQFVGTLRKSGYSGHIILGKIFVGGTILKSRGLSNLFTRQVWRQM
jgi:hypothetical protein